jgi:hypothetical protein
LTAAQGQNHKKRLARGYLPAGGKILGFVNFVAGACLFQVALPLL